MTDGMQRPLRHGILLFSAFFIVSPAFAQEAPAGPSLLSSLLFPVALLVIFYFLLIRPQQRRQKQHRDMVDGVSRGDTIVTSGGLIAKVTKVADAELTVELADGIRVRVVKGMIADVRGKGQPVAANDSKPS